MVGTVKSVKRLRSGDILVEVASSQQAANILRLEKIIDSPVKVTPHRTLNYSRMVIHCPDIKDLSTDEIVKELSDQGVCEARKFGVKGTFCLTFSSTSPPSYVNIGFLRCKCSPFVPNPIRCFKCQKLGHGSNDCKGNPRCRKCGQEGHINDDCINDACCVNCSGPHEALSKQCPVWIREKGVLKIKTIEKVSIPEARRVYYQIVSPSVPSFAQVASLQPTKPETAADTSTQTDKASEPNHVSTPSDLKPENSQAEHRHNVAKTTADGVKKTCGVEQNLNLYLIQELIKSPGFRNAVVEIFADHKRSVLRHNMAVTPADRVEKSSSNSRKIISQQRPVITSHLAHNKAKKHKASSQF